MSLQKLALDHQRLAVTALQAGLSCLEQGREAIQADGPVLRRNLLAALETYQTFKHQQIFDPGARSADRDLRAAAISLKADCIAAGEAYRRYTAAWSFGEADLDWSHYVVAARLIAKVLRRALVDQLPAVLSLAQRLEADPGAPTRP